MSESHRPALGYAGVVAVAVGALAGVLANATVFVPLDRAASTIEARLAALLVVGVIVAVGMLYVAVPVGIGAVRAREDGNWRRHGAVATAAIFGPPLFVFGSLYLAAWLRIDMWPLVFLAVALLVVTALVGVGSLGKLPSPDFAEWPLWPLGLHIAVVVVFAVGFVAVQPLAVGFVETHTDTYGGFGGPHAVFAVEERATDDGTVVAFTHDGGDPLVAENIEVRGDGFADVAGVDHTGPGVWNGEVSGQRPRRGGEAVVYGDTVTVGVEADCEILLVYDGEDPHAISHHTCGRQKG